MMMAFREVNSYCIISSSACCLHQFRPLHFRKCSKLWVLSSNYRSQLLSNGYGRVRICSVYNLVDSVLEELGESPRIRRVRATSSNKVGLASDGELLEDKVEKQGLRGGLLLEFKDSERVLLAVAQRPDGKKNWMVADQNGVISSINPQQITYIIPGVEKFDHSQIPEFVQKAQDKMDTTLLQLAWAVLLESNKSVTAEELAEMIFGISEPLESYCAHLLLSKDDVYFSVLETEGYHSIYSPRPADKVNEILSLFSPIVNEIERKPETKDEVNNIGVKAALSMLKFYKREISPLLPKSCRYVPTCSEYSMIAYKKYGVVKGTILTAWRLCRCNPLGGSGFDPPRWFDEEPAAEE